MKKALIFALVIGLIAGAMAAPATAKKKKKKKKPVRIERVVDFTYVCPCPGVLQLGSATGGDPNLGGGSIPTGAEDRYVTGVATDQSGQAVEVSVQGDTNGDGLNDPIGDFCGETTEPIEIPAGTSLNIFINGAGVCADGATPAVGAGGTVVFTFSNLP
ncbi:MAG: hypothetical protein ACRDLB_03140 [Actinomycetota bacterium]